MKNAKNSISTYDKEQVVGLVKRTQNLESEKALMHGILLFIMGSGMLLTSQNINGSYVRSFISGTLLDLSIGLILTEIFCSSIHLFRK